MTLLRWRTALVAMLVSSAVSPRAQEAARSATGFDARVAAFWKEFADDADEMHARMFEPWMREHAEVVGARVDRVVPRLSWTFGPGDRDGEHAFVLSPEGDVHHALLARRWIARAPKLAGWVFRAGKPPADLDELTIGIDERMLAAKDVRVATDVDVEGHVVHVLVDHPAFAKLPECVRLALAFAFLDAALGEEGTEAWIGAVELGARDDAIPLTALRERVRAAFTEHEWPLDLGVREQVYSRAEEAKRDGPPRSDAFVGRTTQHALIVAFHEAQERGEPLADPLAGTGARYAFLAFDAGRLDAGQQAAQRGAIEDALESRLSAAAVLGGAHGHRNAYIDLVIFDEDRTRAELRAFFAKHEQIDAVMLHGFADDGCEEFRVR